MIIDNVNDDEIFFVVDENNVDIAQKNVIFNRIKSFENFIFQTSNKTIFIISRNEIATNNFVESHDNVVQMNSMHEKNALALLNTRLSFSEFNKANAKTFVWILKRMFFAIIYVATYIKTKIFTTIMFVYFELFRENEINQMRFLNKNVLKNFRRNYNIRRAIIATWQISFIQIQKTKQSIANLFALMNMFDKQKISIVLLRNNINRFNFDDVLTSLLNFFFVRIEIEKQSFKMHRLMQLFMKKWFETNKQLNKWTKKSIKILIATFFNENYKTWINCQMFFFHVKEVIDHETKNETNVTNQTQLILNLKWYLFFKNEYKTTKKIVRVSIETKKKYLNHHIQTRSSMSINLSRCCRDKTNTKKRKRCIDEHWKNTKKYLNQNIHTRSSIWIISHVRSRLETQRWNHFIDEKMLSIAQTHFRFSAFIHNIVVQNSK